MTESQQVRGRHTGSGPTDSRAADVPDRPGEDRDAQGREVTGGHPGQVASQHPAHGQSVASWTAVSGIMLGALIMAVAIVITSVWLFVVGAVVVVLGAISGKVLSAMGFGVSGRPGH
jgi:hypothetical protein